MAEKVHLKFIVDVETDADILAWWQQQENKSAAVRAAIRATLEPEPPPLTTADIRQVLREELAQVELAAQRGEPHDEPPITADVDPAAAARLDNLF